ncbi:hypothetical protein PH547_21165 [Rhizobium sp. CNPSo 3464]|uniref:hypothetical protein n=1 Tax=Rhizobium sp. CNPSo 3464 TaxID=3021406 RepID=UPI00254B6BA4|nr:hypothetical protein [Rhizobium sp. CNPSo 3464]MDK4741400.1 hypothetical protein [Rhizobium sp. CNPSo 3464]
MPTDAPKSDETPRDPNPSPGVSDRTQEKPPVTPAKDAEDSKNPNDPPLDPALLPTGDPSGAA